MQDIDTELSKSDSVNDLGVIIDNKLKFSDHVAKITRIAYLKSILVLNIMKTKKN